MFDIQTGETGEILLLGRWDTSQTARAEAFFKTVNTPTVLDFDRLEYISSAGLGILILTQKRLHREGGGLTLANVNPHITNVLRLAGLDRVFHIVQR